MYWCERTLESHNEIHWGGIQLKLGTPSFISISCFDFNLPNYNSDCQDKFSALIYFAKCTPDQAFAYLN